MIVNKEINYEKDVRKIVDLLRVSLNSNHSEDSFLWKHFDNPFGSSFGLLAWDEDKLIGVRMFMRWEFHNGIKTIKAIRPVDTVTHKDYRGKGIFRKLTLEGLELLKGKFEIVFNTPNQNSYPGNIKMGWEKYSYVLNYKLLVMNPLNSLTDNINIISIDQIEAKEIIFEGSLYQTRYSNDYLSWRYKKNDYQAAILQVQAEMVYVIFRLSKIKGLKVIMICEIFGASKLIEKALRQLSSKLKFYLIYYLENRSSSLKLKYSFKRNEGLVVIKDDISRVSKNLSFSLGDLEGRI